MNYFLTRRHYAPWHNVAFIRRNVEKPTLAFAHRFCAPRDLYPFFPRTREKTSRFSDEQNSSDHCNHTFSVSFCERNIGSLKAQFIPPVRQLFNVNGTGFGQRI